MQDGDRRNRKESLLRLKHRITAAVIALAAAIPAAGFAVAGTASAATPSCGSRCVNVFSWQFGNFAHPGFVFSDYKQKQAAGNPVILFRTSNNDPGLDFTVSAQGRVSEFYAAGLVSSKVALHYGCTTPAPFPTCSSGLGTFPDDPAIEFEYAPYGADTGLCVGVPSTAVSGTKVALEPCGVSSKTVWIIDTFDAALTREGLPLINGSDTNFSHPFVLTYPGSSYPTDQPRPQLFTANLTGESNGSGPVLGTVDSNQKWSATFGILP